MTDDKKFSAVILGGGIAGISAALELARLGHEVALVEKTPFFGGRAARSDLQGHRRLPEVRRLPGGQNASRPCSRSPGSPSIPTPN